MKAFALAALLAFALTTAVHGAGLITIDVQDANLADVLALLGAEAGANIVPDSSLKPERISLHLRNVTFENALTVLVSAHGLQVRREGSVLIVGDAQSMNRRYDLPNSQLGAQTAVLSLVHAVPDDVAKELTPALPEGTVIVADKRTRAIVITGTRDTVLRARFLVQALDGARSAATSAARAYRLRYVRVDDAIKALKILASGGTFVPDEAHNAVIVDGGDAVQRTAERLFETIDRASPQVMFEVKVADVTPDTSDSNVGFEWGGSDLQGHPTNGSTTYAFTRGSIPVNVRLNSLMQTGRAQILATPKLVTLNNKEADLLIGQTYPVVYNTSVLGGQNVQFVDIGVKLRLTPTIGPDGVVTADLHPEYSELLGIADNGYPIIANRKIDSTLRVADSQTIVLGGLMRDVDNETITKVPGLAQIPILGKFFQNRQKHHERDEIVFLITPHVIYPAASTKP